MKRQKVGRIHRQRRGDQFQLRHCKIGLCALNGANLGSVEGAFVTEYFLAEASGLAQSSDIGPEDRPQPSVPTRNHRRKLDG